MHKVVDQYNAFKLNEYNGTFEIVSGNDSEGKFWMNWAIASEYDSEAGGSIPAKKDNGSYRNVPIKVILGNREKAVENLKWLLGQLEGHNPEESSMDESQEKVHQEPDNDVPF